MSQSEDLGARVVRAGGDDIFAGDEPLVGPIGDNGGQSISVNGEDGDAKSNSFDLAVDGKGDWALAAAS